MRTHPHGVNAGILLSTLGMAVALELGCASNDASPHVAGSSGSPGGLGVGGSSAPIGGTSNASSGGQSTQPTGGNGSNSGGATATNGTGGAASTGGTNNTTTSSATGGTSTGGVPQMGLGGATSTGGRSTGGSAAGGSSTGGDTATGGRSAGGTATTGGTLGAPGGAASSTGSAPTTNVGGSSANCGIADSSAGDRNKRQFLVRDEGLHQIAFLDLGNPTRNWYTTLASEVSSGVQGRDMQLVGDCRVLVGTDLGYEEYDIATGTRVGQLTGFSGTVSAHRLRNRNTLLVGLGTSSAPYQGSSGAVLVEVNAAGVVVKKIVYAGISYARLVRETPAGTYLVAANTEVFEGKADGTILAQRFNVAGTTANAAGVAATHAWKALRLPNGETLVSAGYGATLSYFTATGTVRKAITGGGTSVNASFYSGFQLLTNGNVLVVNWQGHNAGNWSKGLQLLEYTPEGTLAWSFADASLASKLSSLQAAILLDGLDASKLQVEDTTGQLVAVP